VRTQLPKEANRITAYLKHLPKALFWFSLLALAAWVGYWKGRSDGMQERKNECDCGQTQTCAFGTGIVGEQKCRSGIYGNRWSRCEPTASARD